MVNFIAADKCGDNKFDFIKKVLAINSCHSDIPDDIFRNLH
jgi:hypothetical protein